MVDACKKMFVLFPCFAEFHVRTPRKTMHNEGDEFLYEIRVKRRKSSHSFETPIDNYLITYGGSAVVVN